MVILARYRWFEAVAVAAVVLGPGPAPGQPVPGTLKPRPLGTGEPYQVPGTGHPLVQQVPGTGQPYLPPVPTQPWPPGPALTLGVTGVAIPGFGVRITGVQPYSAAERMGLEVNGVIMQVNGRPIRNWYDLHVAIATSGGFVRILNLDSRTNTYVCATGYL